MSKQINCTEHTFLYPNGGIAKIEVVYTSCEGPIEDYIGYGDVVTGNLITTYDLIVNINHKVMHQLYTATVAWFDESTREGVVRLTNGEHYWFNDSLPLYRKDLARRDYKAGDVFTAELYDNDRCVADFNRSSIVVTRETNPKFDESVGE